jgi:hypothetical protein
MRRLVGRPILAAAAYPGGLFLAMFGLRMRAVWPASAPLPYSIRRATSGSTEVDFLAGK